MNAPIAPSYPSSPASPCLRAERRIGELIAAQRESVGLNKGASAGGKKASPRGSITDPRDTLAVLLTEHVKAAGGKRPKGTTGTKGRISRTAVVPLIEQPTLADLGVTRKIAAAAQRLVVGQCRVAGFG